MIYLNSVKIGENIRKNKGIQSGNNPLLIGNRVDGEFPLIGKIDLIRIFNISLSNQEIKKLSGPAGRGFFQYIEYPPLVDSLLSDILEKELGRKTGRNLVKEDIPKLSKLKNLDISNLKINNFSVLQHCIGLRTLKLSNNNVTDISFLSNLLELETINLLENKINDISALAKLNNLTHLNIEKNRVRDLEPLVTNEGASGETYLKSNPLSNTALTTHIPELKARGITLEHDAIPSDIIKMSNVSFEKALRTAIDIPTGILTPTNTSALVDLDLTNTGIIDLDVEALKALPNLKSLNLTNNPLSSNAVVVQIPELESSGITVDLGTSAAAKVELSSDKPAIPASLSATTDITVTVTDANGNKVKRETVDLTADKGTIQTPAVNNGDGIYTATYAAVDVSGDVTISALTSNGKFGSLQIKLVEVAVSKDESLLEIVGSNKAKTDETASVVVTLV